MHNYVNFDYLSQCHHTNPKSTRARTYTRKYVCICMDMYVEVDLGID